MDFNEGDMNELDLDVSKLKTCMADESTSMALKNELAEAGKAGVQVTPTFYIGTLDSAGHSIEVKAVLQGAQPFSAFKQALEAVLHGVKAES